MNSWPLVLVGVLAVGHLVRGQDEPAPIKPSVRWEYLTQAWTGEDTELMLRAATGDGSSNVASMLGALAEVSIPRSHPGVQRAIDARLSERLTTLGADGWELVWIRDGTTIAADRYELSAPTLILKRRSSP